MNYADQDVIVSLGGVDAELDGAGARPHLSLENSARLSTFLSNTHAASITLRAPWSELTTGVLCELAEWAADRPRRGCGVLPIDQMATSGIRRAPALPMAILFDETGSRTLTQAGLRPVPAQTCLELLSSSTPPVALAVSGHGGEHCIGIGDHWLATYEGTALPGPSLSPEAVRCRAMFLNTCGSLRLGDSVVPRKYSLASHLCAQGTAVVGAFRNQFTLPNAALIFAQAVMSMMPMGQVVSRLNLEAYKLGKSIVSYQLLGDAADVVADSPVSAAISAFPASRPVSETLVNEMAWLDQVYATIGSWAEHSSEAVEAHRDFVRSLRLVFMAGHVNTRAAMTDTEMDLLEQIAQAAAGKQRVHLLEELARYTLRGIWPQSLCSPVSAPPAVGLTRCQRCGSRVVRLESIPLTRGALPVCSEDCDSCGTLSDTIGKPPAIMPIDAQVCNDEIHVRVPPLNADCVGKIIVHRSRSVPPQPWPVDGGVVRIPIAPIPFRGKTTIACTQIGPGFLTFNYATIFVDSAF